MVELADARDSKSRVRKNVRVRPPPPAPNTELRLQAKPKHKMSEEVFLLSHSFSVSDNHG